MSQVGVDIGSTTGALSAATAGRNTTTGNALTVPVVWVGAQTITGITDNVVGSPNVFTQLASGSPIVIAGQQYRIAVYECASIVGRTGHIVTATLNGTVPIVVWAVENSGRNAASIFDGTPANATAGSGTHTGVAGASIVTADAGSDLLTVTVTTATSAETVTPSGGLAVPASNGSLLISGQFNAFLMTADNKAAGTYAGGFSTSGFDGYAQIIVALAAAVAATKRLPQKRPNTLLRM